MEQGKIDELKKLMAFGLLLVDRINNSINFNIIIKTMTSNDIVEALAHSACVFEQVLTEQYIEKFKEPETTQLLEKAYSEFLEFKNENGYEE